MAHVQKFKRDAVAAMMHHYTRDNDRTLGRSNIDPERTRDNYAIGPERGREYVAERIGEIERAQGRSVRKDAVAMCDWVVTAPPDLRPEDRRRFFEACRGFFEERYGERNMLGCWVHMDETTPHAHIAFMPVVERDGIERLSAKDVLNRAEMGRIHPELSRRAEREIGYRVQVQLDDDRQIERALSKVDGLAAYQREKDRLERLRRDQRDAERRNRNLAGKAERLRGDVARLERDALDAGKRVERERERARGLAREVARARQACEEREEKVAQVRGKAQEARRRIGYLERKIEGARDRCRELAERVRDLRERAAERLRRPHAERMERNVERAAALVRRDARRRGNPSEELRNAYEGLSRRERAMLHDECPSRCHRVIDGLEAARRAERGYVPHVREWERDRTREWDREWEWDRERW